jgi:hypothetical protein
MEDDGDEQPDGVPDLSVAQSTPLYYANVVQVYAGPYDLTIEFGHKHPELLATEHYVPVCRVAMSLSHAKILLPILAKLIADYETRFGVIPAPGYDQLSRE